MKQYIFNLLGCLFLILPSNSLLGQQKTDLTTFVDPFIGTGAIDGGLLGNTFPGATMPFGFVQLSPDTRNEISMPSGYDYNDKTIFGFSHTHLNGTGIPDLFDVLVTPYTGKISANGYASRFSHDREAARPGYYQVDLLDHHIHAELTATVHTGFHRYVFPATDSAYVRVDLNHAHSKRTFYPHYNIASDIKVIDDKTIEGYRYVAGWAKFRKVFFRMEFSRPFIRYELKDQKAIKRNDILVPGENGFVAILNFDTRKEKELLVKVGLSPVSIENARQNLQAELPDWNFGSAVLNANAAWEKELGKIKVEGTLEQKKIFYTGLYHAFIQPNQVSDVNGDYQASDLSLKNSGPKKQYSTFSLWDTYRAVHPLYTLVQPERTSDMVNSMITQYETIGLLPVWQLWGDETYCMIGNHGIPVVVDAALKGIKGVDLNRAYDAVKGSSDKDHLFSNFSLLDKYHYLPHNLQSQSVSVMLEIAFDDWCVAQLAKKLGKTKDYEYFMKRSGYISNLFDRSTGFFRARDSNSNWVTPFNPLQYGGNGKEPYTEANAWQYLWSVQQDIEGLKKWMGGNRQFSAKLDQFFTIRDTSSTVNYNASGFIGQYAHGNEPSHHVAYLYNFAAQPWKSQYYVSKIMNELYNTSSSGYSGNEDCGQMSAWYIFSAMGFYPVNPANGVYIIGAPCLAEARIELGNGKSFKMHTENYSKENIYIQSVKWNGKEHRQNYITHQAIMDGGVLEFKMGPKPNQKWGSGKIKEVNME